MDLKQANEIYERLNYEYLLRKSNRDRLLSEKESLENSKREVLTQLDLKNKTAEFLRALGNYAREQVKAQLESTVTHALRFIFKENIEFKIEYRVSRGRPEATFYVVSEYEDQKTKEIQTVKNEPQDSRGGGVVDVVSIALRIALAESFGIKGPIIMDEPAKHLSKDYIPSFAEFLRLVSQQLNRQIIMITHNPILAECGDIIHEVTKNNGVSKVVVYSKEEYITKILQDDGLSYKISE